MKKRQFVHSFSLLLLLVVAIAFIFMYSNLKFTGFATEGETPAEESTPDASSVEDSTSTETPAEEVEETEEVEEEIPAEEVEETEEVEEDVENLSAESAEVVTSCGDGAVQNPNDDGIAEVCDEGTSNGQVCTASYDSTCTYCSSDCLTLTSMVGATCGDGTCNAEESCTSCSADCGCTSAELSSSDGSSDASDSSDGESSVQVSVNALKKTCIPNWECGNWQECVDGTQERACIDVNVCEIEEGMPETLQYCVVEIIETCFDEIKNQDEVDTDCGGVCEKKCGFLTMVGSVVGDQIEVGKEFVFKEMFGNVTRIIISTSVLVFVLGGIVIVVFFWKKKMGLRALDKAIDNLSSV